MERERSLGRTNDKPVITPDTVATVPLILEKNLIKNHPQLIQIKNKNESSYNIMVIQERKGVNISIKIAELIEKERTKSNISKAKLAEKVGCTSRAIDYWENGERSISLENADKIFKALGTAIVIGNGSKLNER